MDKLSVQIQPSIICSLVMKGDTMRYFLLIVMIAKFLAAECLQQSRLAQSKMTPAPTIFGRLQEKTLF